jgi:hypothetical protein
MPSYLEIALRVTSPAHSTHPEPRSNEHASTEVVVPKPQARSNELAQCGSSGCAGCYEVGDGRKIHPPRCGKDYLDWFKRWEEKGGRVQ